jgi:hypothetical protein
MDGKTVVKAGSVMILPITDMSYPNSQKAHVAIKATAKLRLSPLRPKVEV